MPFELTFLADYARLRILEPRAEAFVAGFQAFVDHPGFRLRSPVLWDLTGLSGPLAPVPEDVDRILTGIREAMESRDLTGVRSDVRGAVLVPSDLLYGMARVFQARADLFLPTLVEVFREEEAALAWLLERSDGRGALPGFSPPGTR